MRPHTTPDPALAAVARLLAEPERRAHLLDGLLAEAAQAVGGNAWVLLRLNPRTGGLHATSASCTERTPPDTDAWHPGEADAQRLDQILSNGRPEIVAPLAGSMPRLAGLLGSSAALAVPLLQDNDPLGLVAIGMAETGDPGATLAQGDWIAHAFVLALELVRLRREADLARELRTLTDGFSRIASSSLDLGVALDASCRDAAALFDAERAAVWLHDREARTLVLAASSDPAHGARGTRVPAESALSPAALAMRRPKAEFRGHAGLLTTVTVPLKGRRRALGTIVLDNIRVEPGTDLDVLDAADELGRQLSSAIENVLLLDEVLRVRRKPQAVDLVAVCDAGLRVVDVNQPLADRLGMTREQAAGRYLADCLGLQAAEWIRGLDLWGPSARSETFTRELDDPILDGRFSFTLSPLLGTEGEPRGAVLVARGL